MESHLSLREIQLAEFELLKQFDAFCNEHDLRYSLYFGTLLGAVRHKGFIPWDDDLDISMPRPDFERLRLLEDELPKGIALMHPGNAHLVSPMMKIIDMGIRMQEPAFEGIVDEYLWIDIFPLDGAARDSERQMSSIGRINKMLVHLQRTDLKRFDSSRVVSLLRKLYTLTSGGTNQAKRYLPKMERVAREVPYEASELILGYYDALECPHPLSRAAYEKTIPMEFEGHEFPVMSCWDEYLTMTYGDYMQLPPESERQTHHVKAWRV